MKIIILATTLLLVGCGDTSKIQKAKQAVSFKLIDGTSAQFFKVAVRQFSETEVVCGYVNSKNIRGNYVGNSRFIYELESENLLFEAKKKSAPEWINFETRWEIDCNLAALIE